MTAAALRKECEKIFKDKGKGFNADVDHRNEGCASASGLDREELFPSESEIHQLILQVG